MTTLTTSTCSKAKKSAKRGPKRTAQRARHQLTKLGHDPSDLDDAQAIAQLEEVYKTQRSANELNLSTVQGKVDMMKIMFEEIIVEPPPHFGETRPAGAFI